jgi:hypothetical protein
MSKPVVLSCLGVVLAAVFVLSGCARLGGRPETSPLMDKQALALSLQAKSFNRHIVSSRGTALARIETPGRSFRYKMAWAAVFPDKIRITFLLSGLPVETIAADGERVIFFSHTGEHGRHTYQGKDPDMEDYIKVPVKLSEIILVLLGRLPVKPFDDAYFLASDASLSTIFLGQEWRGMIQSLHFDGQAKIHRLVSMNRAGNPAYEMTITRYKIMGSNRIPVGIKIRNQDRAKLTLDILNFQSNPSIKESVFQLTEPGS